MIYWIGLLACRFLAFCPPFCYTYLIKEMGFYETENRGYSFAGGAVLLLAGCSGEPGSFIPESSQTTSIEGQAPEEEASGTSLPGNSSANESPAEPDSSGSSMAAEDEISRETAFALALENAGVPEKDAYNVKVERDRENDIPIFQVEFETEYGDYDFEIAVAGGKIIGADYEVDEEWLDRLGGSPVTLEEAEQVVQSKVPGSSAENIRMREESGDGRGRFEGELFHDGIQYEFEIDSKTGIIFDWNADLRE